MRIDCKIDIKIYYVYKEKFINLYYVFIKCNFGVNVNESSRVCQNVNIWIGIEWNIKDWNS